MNKKLFFIIGLIICSAFSVYAQNEGKQLIVIYPSSRNSNLSGEVDTVTYASGNTVSIAGIIEDLTGADVFEIELASPYSSRYNTVLREAKDDQKIQARPELKNSIDNFDQYDTVYLGFANWWASIPMPIATLLENYDFSGKRIIPFCTHGGGRFGQSISAIAKLSPASEILEPFEVYYGGRSSLERDVKNWLLDNGVELK